MLVGRTVFSNVKAIDVPTVYIINFQQTRSTSYSKVYAKFIKPCLK